MLIDARAAILDAATATFGARGLRATSMQDVVAAAGVSKPTLYRHCPTKESLLVGLYEHVMDDALATAEAIATDP
ncbi:MAG: TetR/AcrR family transcriptional regulator [Actinomycetota bacterium]|nr:TetR/AcrR family transcriptional regulator [Actinomycetota bacterium]